MKTYSLGMRQRLGIAQALLGKPKLLILDEPTNGLDPQGIKELRQFIRRLADSGISVFISSHLLGEIQLMCDRVAIIRRGEVISVGRVEELVGGGEASVVWHVSPGDIAFELLGGEDGIRILDRNDKACESRLEAVHVQMHPERIPLLNEKMVRANVRVHSIETKTPTLEDLFLRLTEGERID